MILRSARRTGCSLFLIAITTSAAMASAPDTLWTRAYGGTAWDDGNDLRQTSDGGFIVAGMTQSFGQGSYDVYLLRTDARGDTLWTRTFGGPGLEDARGVIETRDGGFAIIGRSASSGAGGSDLYVVRTNANGEEVWSKTYGGSDEDDGQAILELPDGGFWLVGQTASEGNGDDDVYLVRVDSSGETLTTRTYGGPQSEDAQDARLLADGGLVLGGSTYSYGSGGGDFYLLRTDAAGDTLWTRAIGGSARDLCIALDVTPDGGFILAGQTQSYGNGNDDAWLVRTDSDGGVLWSRAYGESQSDALSSVHSTADGGAVATGVFTSQDDGLETWLLRTDAAGDTSWTTTVHSGPTWDIWDIGRGMTIAGNGDYVVTGLTGLYPGFNLSLIRFGAATGIVVHEPLAWPAPLEVTGAPNPFNPATSIQFSLEEPSRVLLSIHGAAGHRIRTLLREKRSGGDHAVQWDGTDDYGRELASGVYLVRLKTDNRVGTTRIILVK